MNGLKKVKKLCPNFGHSAGSFAGTGTAEGRSSLCSLIFARMPRAFSRRPWRTVKSIPSSVISRTGLYAYRGGRSSRENGGAGGGAGRKRDQRHTGGAAGCGFCCCRCVDRVRGGRSDGAHGIQARTWRRYRVSAADMHDRHQHGNNRDRARGGSRHPGDDRGQYFTRCGCPLRRREARGQGAARLCVCRNRRAPSRTKT